jgi:hypothetical protein
MTSAPENIRNVARGDRYDREVPVAEMAHNIRLDPLQSRCANAAALSLDRRVSMRTDTQRDEVENMCCNGMTEFGRSLDLP